MGSMMKMLITSADSDGELLRMEVVQEKEAVAPPLHYHTKQTEDYEVLSGQLTLTMNGTEVVLDPGDKFHIPECAKHTFHATSAEPCRYIVDHRPALEFEDFMVTLYDLEYDGRSNEKGLPPFLHFAAILNRHRGEQFVAGPPRLAQRLLQLVGAAVGKLRGYETTYRSKAREQAQVGIQQKFGDQPVSRSVP